MLSKKGQFLFLVLVFQVFIKIDGKEPRPVTRHSAKQLSKGSIVSDWNRFNGPSDDASSPETNILTRWTKNEPQILWEISKGEGYSSPAISDGILVLFHRKNGMEQIEGLDAETGVIKWTHKYPVDYEDRYGYSSGPRASPIIDKNHVYTHGVTSWLRCLELKTGRLIWKRNLALEFNVPNYFFGKGSNPIIFEDKIIVNVGGEDGECVVAFNKKNGKTEWITNDSWGASYSSPRITKIHGQTTCLVFTGGESRPPTGGLLLIDPNNGRKLNRFSWRSSKYESANAVPPVPLGGNRIFLSECYEKGGVVIEYDQNFNPLIIWKNNNINIHWMTPVLKNGIMYGIAGRHQQGAETFALNPQNGEVFWRKQISWSEKINDRELNLGLFRGAILAVEGYFICLSELGSLLVLDLNRDGWKIISKVQLFFAPGTWTLPALSKGLLYVMQNEMDRASGKMPRLLCLDLRK